MFSFKYTPPQTAEQIALEQARSERFFAEGKKLLEEKAAEAAAEKARAERMKFGMFNTPAEAIFNINLPTCLSAAAEKSAAEKSAAEKSAAEKSAAEKSAAEKSAAEKSAAVKQRVLKAYRERQAEKAYANAKEAYAAAGWDVTEKVAPKKATGITRADARAGKLFNINLPTHVSKGVNTDEPSGERTFFDKAVNTDAVCVYRVYV